MRKPIPTIGVPKELGDDGADHGERRVDLERVEDERHSRRQAQLQQRLLDSSAAVGLHQVALHRAGRLVSPAAVLTSMGKKVITTTTAALDCQSKPNHITMIGATPTIGSAETRLPIGKQAALQELRTVDQDRDGESGQRCR